MPRYLVLDAFAHGPLRGNPAAVVEDDGTRPDPWRQAVAAAFGFSETAFPVPSGPGRFKLRWFTPTAEIDLCGHATLATTQALGHWGLLPPGASVAFDTRSGELRCGLDGAGARMDFPAIAVQPVPAPAGLLEGLGLPADCPVFQDREDHLVLAPNAAAVRALRPDFARVAAATAGRRGVCVSALAEEDSEADFISRFFGPAAGIDEDPVTGSAHCRLGPFWGARLGLDRVLGEQVSERGGRVGVALNGDRVWLTGTALLREEGELEAKFPGLKAG